MSETPQINFEIINGEKCYIGPERRKERRRNNSNERLEALLRDFGLDRRASEDRRSADTSWLVMPKAANM